MQNPFKKNNSPYRKTESSTASDPGSVDVTIKGGSGDIVISGFDPEYFRNILSAIIQGIQGGTNGSCEDAIPEVSEIFRDKEFDVFISHASEDKERFVVPLVNHLRQLGVRVWYDAEQIEWGDSFRASLDAGLRRSRYGIVVLSPAYIQENKYWTKAELDALFQQESQASQKVLLPIWHHLSKDEIFAYSPFIASRKAMRTASSTVREIAEAVAAIVRNQK